MKMSKKHRKQYKAVRETVVTAPMDNKPGKPVKPSRFRSLLQPHNAFAVLALLFGSIFIITTPPFQVPDECAHVNRTFELSDFHVWQKVKDNKTGNYLPSSLDSAASRFTYLWFAPGNKISGDQISDAFRIPLNKNDKKFIAGSAGNYFYFSYIPQLPAVFIGKLLNLNVLSILYFGKFLALLFYVLCVWYAIKIIPVGKFLMLVVALLPMTLAQAGSFSPDSVSFSFAFLAIALLLDISYNKKRFEFNRQTVLLLAIICLMGILKPVYLPFSFAILLIPKSVFKSRYQYLLTMSLTILVSLFISFGWVKLMSTYGGLQTNVDVNGEIIHPAEKIQAFVKNPGRIVDVLDATLGHFHEMYYETTLGVLGYLDTKLPGGIYTVLTFLLIFLALFEGNEKYRLQIYQRLLLLAISIGIFLATILTMYLLTRDASGLIAEGVQGRYFIPVVFPFLLAWNRIIPWRMNLSGNRLLSASLYFILLVILIRTEFTLYDRFYVDF